MPEQVYRCNTCKSIHDNMTEASRCEDKHTTKAHLRIDHFTTKNMLDIPEQLIIGDSKNERWYEITTFKRIWRCPKCSRFLNSEDSVTNCSHHPDNKNNVIKGV